MKKARIIFCVINDLTYDQRMIRICYSLADNGYDVTLVGRKLQDSKNLTDRKFQQTRLKCIFNKGPIFYAEYNIRLFFYLLFASAEVLTACDLDTALPVRWAARLRGRKSVYDAHEYFTEVPEVMNRKAVKNVWETIGRLTVPNFNARYTVNQSLAEVLTQKYNVPFEVVRNAPVLVEHPQTTNVDFTVQEGRILLYQGALNVGRGLGQSIKAMKFLEGVSLWLVGDGDIRADLQSLVKELQLQERVFFKGRIAPEELRDITSKAFLGLNLLEGESLNYYHSLANKFFDYMHAGVPSLNMAFPAYRAIVEKSEVAILLDDLDPRGIANAISALMEDNVRYEQMRENCLKARLDYHWGKEESTLLSIYQSLSATT